MTKESKKMKILLDENLTREERKFLIKLYELSDDNCLINLKEAKEASKIKLKAFNNRLFSLRKKGYLLETRILII